MLHAVLLRRVNVGGSHVRMVDLLATLEHAGYPAAETVLASGNVVVDSSTDIDTGAIVGAIMQRHGFPTEVFVRRKKDLEDLIEVCPFDASEGKIEVVFMHRALDTDAVGALRTIATGPDLLRPIGREIHWFRPFPLGESTPNERQLRTVIGGDSTRRTMGTVERIVAKMERFE